MKIVLLGAPGSGKGTQAACIGQRYSLPHISTGDIFRENIQKQTEIGLKIKACMDSGNLCPDDLTIELVKERLSVPDCANGYLLDGFPRNIYQAEALDKFSPPDKVLEIAVDTDKIERRITGRRLCPVCGNSYHIDFIGDTEICPNCKGKLITRKDDTPETVKERLKVYRDQTEPLIGYYGKQGKLFTFDGNKKIEEVFADIMRVLG